MRFDVTSARLRALAAVLLAIGSGLVAGSASASPSVPVAGRFGAGTPALRALAAPSAPTGVTAAADGSDEIDLHWSPVAGATGYEVLRSGTSGGPYTSVGTTTRTAFDDPGLTPATTYYYVVQATDSSGNSPNSSEVSATTTPTAPTGVSAAPDDATEIDLHWSPVSGATGYEVLRSGTSGGPYTSVGTTTRTGFDDRGLTPATTYYYVVEATDSGGNSPNSSEVSATTLALASWRLTVNAVHWRAGDLVTSTPGGISCKPVCSAQYGDGTRVTLTAATAHGDTFAGWSGGGCSGTGSCTVTLHSDTTVTATFAPPPIWTLSVNVAGGKLGSVTSSPAGVFCEPTCTSHYGNGTRVTLTAKPTPDGTFLGWSGGACSGKGPCAITLASDTAVTATFGPRMKVNRSLSVSNGAATVSMTCKSSVACKGRLTLTSLAGKSLGSRRYKVLPHHKASPRIPLNARARRLLRHKHRLTAELSIDPSGVAPALAAELRVHLVKR